MYYPSTPLQHLVMLADLTNQGSVYIEHELLAMFASPMARERYRWLSMEPTGFDAYHGGSVNWVRNTLK